MTRASVHLRKICRQGCSAQRDIMAHWCEVAFIRRLLDAVRDRARFQGVEPSAARMSFEDEDAAAAQVGLRLSIAAAPDSAVRERFLTTAAHAAIGRELERLVDEAAG